MNLPVRLAHGSPRHRTLQSVGWFLLVLLLFTTPFFVAVPLKPSILGNDYTIGIGNLNTAVSWAVAVLGLNLLGDGLRDALDPRLREWRVV